MIRIRVLPSNGFFGLSASNGLFERVSLLKDHGSITIDLSAVSGINAVGIINLILLLAHLQTAGNRIYIKAPKDGRLNAHLCDEIGVMRIASQIAGSPWQSISRLRSNVQWYNDSVNPGSYTKPKRHKVEILDSVGKAAHFSMELNEILQSELGMDQSVSSAVTTVVTELWDNMEQHSGKLPTAMGGYELQQWQGRPRLLLALGDLGIGIPASLRIAGVSSETEHDVKSVEDAVLRGVSSKKKEDDGRGGGFMLCRENAIKYRHYFGVRSGRGYCLQMPDGSWHKSEVAQFPGTQAYFGWLKNDA